MWEKSCRPSLRGAKQRSNFAVNTFWRDESGQGIIFAAASMILLVCFVALVYNIGNVTERRTKVQLAADACVYSGGVVMANSLSTIGWANSATAQLYYNAVKYAVDVNVTGVAAHVEWQQQGKPPIPNGPAWNAYVQAYRRAAQNIPEAKRAIADLSHIQNAIAILTPRLAEEEMHAVGQRSGTVGEVRGAERISLFPSLRMFPHGESVISYRIEQLEKGWRIINLIGANNEMLEVRLADEDGDGQEEWHIEYSTDGIIRHEVVISEEEPLGADELERWSVRYYRPPGTLVQEIILVHTEDLGWAVWGTETDEDTGEETELPEITFEPVDMIDPPEPGDPGYEDYDGSLDWTEGDEGTRISYQDTSAVFARGPDGRLLFWDPQQDMYIDPVSEETEIAGVKVRVNVTSTIHFPHGSATIGDPTHVRIGNTELVLRNPPTIRTGLGPITIAVRGFDADSFSLSAGGFSLTHGEADGIWRKHYNRREEYWWQHRLTEQVPEGEDALRQWQYDRMVLGATLQYETNMDRFVYRHAIGDRWGGTVPPWETWFDPVRGSPRIIRPDPPHYYYRTEVCQHCQGTGVEPETDPPAPCSVCLAQDHDEDGLTDLQASIADLRTRTWRDLMAAQLLRSDPAPYQTEYDFLDAPVYTNAYGIAAPRMPLVLAPEFFKFGLNVGAWREPGSPMLFSDDREPDWGYVAIAGLRLRIPDPDAPDGYRDRFDDPDDRETWCDDSEYNLYNAGIVPALVASRDQIEEFDLEDDLLQGVSIRDTDESGLSYLWDAILGAGHIGHVEHNGWLDRYDGRANQEIGRRLRNMRDRRGRRFNFRTEELDDVIAH